jgi:hypothetical protein
MGLTFRLPLAMVILVAGTACATATAPAVASPPPKAVAPYGGCGITLGSIGNMPVWMPDPQDSQTPFVIAIPPLVAAILAGYPLRAGNPSSPSNKVAWAVRTPRNGTPLFIDASPVGKQSPRVHIESPSNSWTGSKLGPSEIYVSTIDLPAPGCWELTLRWGGPPQQARMDLQISPAHA